MVLADGGTDASLAGVVEDGQGMTALGTTGCLPACPFFPLPFCPFACLPACQFARLTRGLVRRRNVFQHVQGVGYHGKKHLQALLHSLGAAG